MPDINETQEVLELVLPSVTEVRETQEVLELVLVVPVQVNVTQEVLELVTAPLDLSGLYYINPGKPTRVDSYYNNLNMKIPDPTWRTALLGD